MTAADPPAFDIIEIPGSPKFSLTRTASGRNPSRFVQLPIVITMSRGQAIFSIAKFFIYVILSMVSIGYVLKAFYDGIPLTGHHGRPGSWGETKFILVAGVFILPVLLLAASEKAILSLVALRSGPCVLRLDRNFFWHVQLSQAIPLEDILAISSYQGKNYRIYTFAITSKNPVKFRYYSGLNPKLKAVRCRFTFRNFAFGNFQDVFDVIKILTAKPNQPAS